MNKIITPNFKKSNNTYIKKEYFVKLKVTDPKGFLNPLGSAKCDSEI